MFSTKITLKMNCGTSSEFVSSSIPSWQILTAHAQPFRGARDLAFCLKVLLDSLLVWASSGGSGETAPMRRLAWTFAARIGNKYRIRLTRLKCFCSKGDSSYPSEPPLALYYSPLKCVNQLQCGYSLIEPVISCCFETKTRIKLKSWKHLLINTWVLKICDIGS